MDSIIDPKKLRFVASAFATGITVVTVQRPNGTIQGMTANSFLSVSLSPPLVSFCIRVESSMMSYLKVGKGVGISILNTDQKEVSIEFASKNAAPSEIQMTKHSAEVYTIENCLAWYHCSIDSILPAGDHFIVLCKVHNLDRSASGNPLLYYSGYQQITPIE